MNIGEIFQQIVAMIKGLSLMRKITMATILVVATGTVIYLAHLSGKTSFTPLFTNLNSDDTGSIVTQLDKMSVQYKVDAERKTILVPTNDVLGLRMKLASQGLPRFGGVGFELFDKSGFGMSEFEQKLNYQRALQGELTRTINELSEVEDTRVHLVIPGRSLFTENQEEPTASIVLKLGANDTLSRPQVNAIVHLVASAVEGLDPARVTVIDTAGHLLSSGGDEETAAGGKVFDQKVAIEKSLERQVVGLLEPLVGMGKAVVRASVDVDFARLEETVQRVDPKETVVLSETSSKNSQEGSSSAAGGAAGIAANMPGAGQGGGSSGSNTSNENTSSTTYDVTRITRRQVIPSGAVKKISMAVVVDGTYQEKDGKPSFVARSPEEMTKIAAIVKSAVGFDQNRGDVVQVDNMAFVDLGADMKGAPSFFAQRDTYSFILTVAVNVVIVGMGLLVIFFVVRPLIKGWRERQMATVGANGTPMISGAVLSDPEKIRGEIGKLIGSNPAQAANVIRQWMAQ